MNIRLLVYWFRTISKPLVWLLAALVSLQGVPSASCCSAAQAKVAADASKASTQHGGCCCCCQRTSLPVEPLAATRSCCQRAGSDVKRTCCCCGRDCQCQKGDSSPRPTQIPPEHRTQSNDLTAGPLVILFFECDDRETMATDGRKATSLSGSDRCVLLCRFHL